MLGMITTLCASRQPQENTQISQTCEAVIFDPSPRQLQATRILIYIMFKKTLYVELIFVSSIDQKFENKVELKSICMGI